MTVRTPLVFVTTLILVALSGCAHEASFPLRVENHSNTVAAFIVTIQGTATGTEYFRFNSTLEPNMTSDEQRVQFTPHGDDKKAFVYQVRSADKQSRYETAMYSSVVMWTVRINDERIDAPLTVT